ncbi:golgin subfamily A member 4 isoform X2 [Teleopsis dalmanni]|uniref:golgin subfamily A member 4 isoform X2 n=1 Tax=Teleopsis dalmanni TaxID=139649 RepID=UPI0018CEB19C|nr:golgin subfamily A member 4 isoform X2 [Teleopsis dalmanni]
MAAVSSSTSTTPSSDSTATTNENFFSITEEDTPQNSPHKEHKLPLGATRARPPTPQKLNNGTGAIPRTRKLSNSSMASDVSFRLPSYEATAVYHLQSDWDASGSEMDDSASTTKLDIISKEQLYDAYRKSIDRYHKYRCRYTDLAKKYKDLERDSAKARSVLVETQDKAIRRISELREQCTLEQQAKAHLEEALRIEMDDLQCKMQAYQTKLSLLGENPENVSLQEVNGTISKNNLIDLDSITENETQDKLLKLERQLQERDMQLEQMNKKLNESTTSIELLKKQEEENVLLLAQTKQAIHSELENKEKEVQTLTETLKQKQTELQLVKDSEALLNSQLIEFKELKETVKKILLSKQELEAKVIASEHNLKQLKVQHELKETEFIDAEKKIAELLKELERNSSNIQQQNEQLSQIMQRFDNQDNITKGAKSENDYFASLVVTLDAKLQEYEAKLKEQEQALTKSSETDNIRDDALKVDQLKKELEDLKLQKDIQDQHIQKLEAEIRESKEQTVNNENQAVNVLKEEISNLNKSWKEQVDHISEELAIKDKELSGTNSKLTKQKKQYDNLQNKVKNQNEEIEKLKIEINKHEENLQMMLNDSKQVEIEKKQLESQVTNILQEISQMENQMSLVQRSHAELEKEKVLLETHIEHMQQETLNAAEGTQRWRELLKDTEEKLKQAEGKLQNVQSENSQLAEKNCLLEENTNRLEKLLTEKDRYEAVESTNMSEIRGKLETAENTIQKLNEKMSQVFDENSHMQNAQELMDHDYRTLQDKYDSLEKEKLLLEDAHNSSCSDLQRLREETSSIERKLEEMEKHLRESEINLSEEERISKNRLEEIEALNSQLSEIRITQSDDDKLRDLLTEKQKQNEALIQKELDFMAKIEESENRANLLENEVKKLSDQIKDIDSSNENQVEALQTELLTLKEVLREKTEANNELLLRMQDYDNIKSLLETTQAEVSTFGQLRKQVELELEQKHNLLEERSKIIEDLQKQLGDDVQVKERSLEVEKEIEVLRKTETDMRAELSTVKKNHTQQLNDMQLKLLRSTEDVETLHESNDAIQLEMDQLKTKHQLQMQKLENELKNLQLEHERLNTEYQNISVDSEKLEEFEQLKLENEYLYKHTKQIQDELDQHKTEALEKLQESNDTKEKLKSLQCELYVLKENAEKHDEEIKAKDLEMCAIKETSEHLKKTLEDEHVELVRQTDHAKYVTEQNDAVQKDLLHTQMLLADVEQKLQTVKTELEKTQLNKSDEIKAKEILVENLRADLDRNSQTIDGLNREVSELKTALEEKQKLQEEIKALKVEITERTNTQKGGNPFSETETTKMAHSDLDHLRKINECLQRELEDLKYTSKADISSLQQELEDMQSNAALMTEELRDLKEASKAQSNDTINLKPQPHTNVSANGSEFEDERVALEAKLKSIMSEVQDVSNRNIFLEQKCENYLILEQSNERLKLQNAKLSRQLDETLVSMQHNEGITANTEFEYLKNIMFQYLTGSANGNNETLVKVISAVLKFSPQQTQVALEKEHQRRSLINKIL